MKLGMGLYSDETHLIAKAQRFYKRGWIDFIEVMLVPTDKRINLPVQFINSNIPLTAHFPHEQFYVNLADPFNEDDNITLLKDAQNLLDEKVIDNLTVHLGSVRDLAQYEDGFTQSIGVIGKVFNGDERLCIENVPYTGDWHGPCYLLGHFPSEHKKHLWSLTFDVDHAVECAEQLTEDPLEYIHEYLAMEPRHFHATDVANKKYLPEDARVVIETQRKSKTSLAENKKDIKLWLAQ